MRERREEAAEALKLTAKDLKQQGIIDRIVPEPLGGAHHDWDDAAKVLKRHVQDVLAELQRLDSRGANGSAAGEVRGDGAL